MRGRPGPIVIAFGARQCCSEQRLRPHNCRRQAILGHSRGIGQSVPKWEASRFTDATKSSAATAAALKARDAAKALAEKAEQSANEAEALLKQIKSDTGTV